MNFPNECIHEYFLCLSNVIKIYKSILFIDKWTKIITNKTILFEHLLRAKSINAECFYHHIKQQYNTSWTLFRVKKFENENVYRKKLFWTS